MHNRNVPITKEQLTEWVSQLDSDGGCDATDLQLASLIRQSLVAMDSKPVIADCDPDVFGKGVSVCLISIPKETAEVICKNITAATGCKVDWHYFGGRVHIKALPPSLQTAPDEMLCDFYGVKNWPDLVGKLVKHVEQLQDSAKRNMKPWEDTFPETLLPAYIERVEQADKACRAAMLQENSDEIGSWANNKNTLTTSQSAPEREQIRREHAEWSQATFGDVGPIGPLKHLSKEALEAAADPHDPLEWADMQFLLWDAQRRMGISDEFITRAMIEKLAINKTRQWPEPKDGEPRLHINQEADNDPNPAD